MAASRLPVAMVSTGLLERAVTRQLERNQDKESSSRERFGAGVGVSLVRWGGDRQDEREAEADTGQRETGDGEPGGERQDEWAEMETQHAEM